MIRRPLPRASQARAPFARCWLAVILLFAASPRLLADIQFDVFFGFDDHVREGHWFPVAFEIRNDGPTFNGTVRLAPEGGLDSQTRSFTLELPTGTRKRVAIPVFSAAGRYTRWEAQLVDPNGKLIAERGGIQPKDTVFRVPLVGALPRTFGGLPKLPEIPGRPPEVPTQNRAAPSRLPPVLPHRLGGLGRDLLELRKGRGTQTRKRRSSPRLGACRRPLDRRHRTAR